MENAYRKKVIKDFISNLLLSEGGKFCFAFNMRSNENLHIFFACFGGVQLITLTVNPRDILTGTKTCTELNFTTISKSMEMFQGPLSHIKILSL